MSSIYGLGPPKMIGTGDPDSNTTIFYYSILDPIFSDKQYKLFPSPVSSSGKQTLKTKGDGSENGRYGTFYIDINLARWDDDDLGYGSLGTARALMTSLFTYEDKAVKFYPFSDGDVLNDGLGKPLKDNSNNDVNCLLVDFYSYFLDKLGLNYDMIRLTFITEEFYKLSKLIQ